jgi:hypothetical protein
MNMQNPFDEMKADNEKSGDLINGKLGLMSAFIGKCPDTINKEKIVYTADEAELPDLFEVVEVNKYCLVIFNSAPYAEGLPIYRPEIPEVKEIHWICNKDSGNQQLTWFPVNEDRIIWLKEFSGLELTRGFTINY